MQNRQNALENWLSNTFANQPFTLQPLAGDASFRRYLRLHGENRSYIVMDSPPDKEPLRMFIQVAEYLRSGNVYAPAILCHDEQQGFAVLEDLGDRLLLQELKTNPPEPLYQKAMDTLILMQEHYAAKPMRLPIFGIAFMKAELALFTDWFLTRYLKLELNTAEQQLIEQSMRWLCEQLIEIPQTFVHKDYHSRNIIVQNENMPLGIIDFQDAMTGPITYDLVSLLKDCYIQWPHGQISNWVEVFYDRSAIAQQLTRAQFKQAFELCGLQRHLKVLGIFARLYLRDNKPNYLHDMPLTLNYTLTALETIKPLSAFYELIKTKVVLP